VWRRRISLPKVTSRSVIRPPPILSIAVGATDATVYRLRGTYDLNWQCWYAATSDEIFANLNSDEGGPKSGFSENRLYGGLGRPFGDRFAIELGYQWRYKNSRGENMITHALLATLTLSLGGL